VSCSPRIAPPHRSATRPKPVLDGDGNPFFVAGREVPFSGFCPCTEVDDGFEPIAFGRAPGGIGTLTYLLHYADGISVVVNVNSNESASPTSTPWRTQSTTSPREPTDHEPARNHHTSTNTIAALVSGALLVAAACGGADDGGSDVGATRPTTAPVPRLWSAPTTVPETTVATTVRPLIRRTLRRRLRRSTMRPGVPRSTLRAATAWGFSRSPEPGGDAESLEAFVAAHREIHETGPSIGSIRFEGPGRTPDELREITAGIDEALDRAAEAAAAGDYLGTREWIDTSRNHLGFLASAFASEGQSCGPADAQRAAEAALNVSILAPWQVEVGFDSVWVSQRRSDTVLRIDPETGEVLARIEMPSLPSSCSPPTERWWCAPRLVRDDRCSDQHDRRQPREVRRRTRANRSWAVDGALWICDGRRLHRYDPTTLDPGQRGRARSRLRPTVRDGRPRDRLVVQRGSG
jgi:hypothetical protein